MRYLKNSWKNELLVFDCSILNESPKNEVLVVSSDRCSGSIYKGHRHFISLKKYFSTFEKTFFNFEKSKGL